MTYPHRPGPPAIARPVAQLGQQPWTARRPKVSPQVSFPMRRFEALALLPDNSLAEVIKRAPAHPIFEGAFCAFARGTIIATEDGPVAVEDLLPGTKVETRDGGYQPLLWIGTITLLPNQQPGQTPSRLFRIPVDSFGPARPMPDLMLAPHARLLHRHTKLREIMQAEAALTPITAFEDGQSVIRVAPASPVSTYHLAFRDHHIVRTNGLEVESFHPGTDLMRRIGADGMRLFMSFFPHLTSVNDFGPMVAPRLSKEEYEDAFGG
ncbi:Hint domain-containing protein [Pseudoruegeria sp. HB172150]|uniref:Hint domain-containing protein n=1 Tax=Pseudoruegeria sp. HB172150 TaxID=2721164 RepID=UPI0015539AF7|nr:Hint domain-containing protein [Pseudoruegeria sp. HB172150]